jgi:hypothetical protein
MNNPTTYGDHITLQALACLYGLQVLVISSMGEPHNTLISDSGVHNRHIFLLTIGHHVEREHYTSIALTRTMHRTMPWGKRAPHQHCSHKNHAQDNASSFLTRTMHRTTLAPFLGGLGGTERGKETAWKKGWIRRREGSGGRFTRHGDKDYRGREGP